MDFMKRAVALAKHANPAPNPQVGAILVQDGVVIGEGFHVFAGGPHAEIVALEDARNKGNDPRGATLYVTLEPCSHHGKTPPCTDALIAAGVKRVVIGSLDQHDVVDGVGTLEEQDIVVDVVNDPACLALYADFFHYVVTKRPFVTLKSAMTLDGKISKKEGSTTWITGEDARYVAHHLRKEHDAILVGIGTVLADNPRLTCRIDCDKQPLRVIVDSHLRIPLDAHVLADDHVVIATTRYHDESKFGELRNRGAKIIVTNGTSVNLVALLRELPNLGVLSLLVEGGSGVNTSFLEQGLVDHVIFLVALRTFGTGVPFAQFPLELEEVTHSPLGEDLYIEGIPKI